MAGDHACLPTHKILSHVKCRQVPNENGCLLSYTNIGEREMKVGTADKWESNQDSEMMLCRMGDVRQHEA